MSAQFMFTFNASGPVEILSDSEGQVVGEAVVVEGAAEWTGKQREALYYIVAVITFYALTFLLLVCKYARFRRKELDDTVPYFPLPPDAIKMAAPQGVVEKEREGGNGNHLLLRSNFGPPNIYGSNDVTPNDPTRPKVMHVRMVRHWLFRREETKACEV